LTAPFSVHGQFYFASARLALSQEKQSKKKNCEIPCSCAFVFEIMDYFAARLKITDRINYSAS
jgi:hypothetical protein